MTPEQARQLLEGTTPGPWEHEGRQPYIDSENFVIRQVGKPGVRIRGAAYGDTANIDLIAAAPGMAEMIAGMTAEYAVQLPDGRLVGAGWGTYEVAEFDRNEWRRDGYSANIAVRYVTAPQPLGAER